MKYVLAATLLLLVGCTTSAPAVEEVPPSTRPTEQTSTHDIEDGIGGPVTVSVLAGSSLSDVRVALGELGLRVDVRRRVRCTAGIVMEQTPAPGVRLARGATVRLVVSKAPAAATCIMPPGVAGARALRSWALGERSAPLFADRVRLLVANRVVRILTGEEAADPDGWVLPLAYAERRDVRILETLTAAPMRTAIVPPFFCLGRGQMLPDDLLRRLQWSATLVTSEPEVRACMDVAAVQVWADRGRITDVNILMGSP